MGDYVFIYGLCDPKNKQLRYIGKSVNPKNRLRRHICDRNKYDTHKDRWLKNLINEGLRPELTIIDEVPKKEWQYWEKFYISYFKCVGCYLTNTTEGGDQPPSTKGRKHTKESRLKMSKTKKGKPIPWLNDGKPRTEEHKKNLSKSLKGRTSPNKGKTFSDEYKKKLSDSHKGIFSGKKHPMYGKKHTEDSINKIKEKRSKQVFTKETITKRAKSVSKKVYKYNLDGKLVHTYNSVTEAAKSIGVSLDTIRRYSNNGKELKGYKWEIQKKKRVDAY